MEVSETSIGEDALFFSPPGFISISIHGHISGRNIKRNLWKALTISFAGMTSRLPPIR